MTQSFNRRRFLKRTAAVASLAGASQLLTVPNILAERSPNSKLNIAGIGVGGRGGAHVEPSLDENLVAVCDVVEGTRQRLPAARRKALQGPRHRQAAAQGVLRLPRDVRQDARPDRRRVRRHARPPSRAGLDDGHQAGQARLLREAADAQHRRGPAADPGGPRAQGGHADGQPGPGRRRLAAAVRDDLGRRDRQRPGGPRLDRSAGHPQAILVAAGRHAARRLRPRARRAELGRVARPGARAAVPGHLQGRQVQGQAGLSAVRLARLVGFRHRRPGRHRLPRHERHVHRPEDRTCRRASNW